MPKRIPPLTESQCKNARYREGGGNRLRDGDGLYLELRASGAKLWRYRYKFAGRENLLSLGEYPTVTREAARRARMDAKALILKGVDPSQQRKADRRSREAAARSSFEAVAVEWFGKFAGTLATSYSGKVMGRLQRDIFPKLGRRPISEIEAPEVLEVLRAVEDRGALETAHRERALMSQIFRYAIATARAKRDPAADLRGALTPPQKQRFPTITDPARIAELMRAIQGYPGHFATCAALRLAPLVFVRPGELIGARWAEIDLSAREWRIPATRRKLTKEVKQSGAPAHIVPLSRQSVAILTEVQRVTGGETFVFRSLRGKSRHISENTLNLALRNMGFPQDEIVAHGFRHMASTFLNDRGWPADAIERQLSHKPPGVRGVYNMAKYLPVRTAMMQAWADYLDALRVTQPGEPLPSLEGPA